MYKQPQLIVYTNVSFVNDITVTACTVSQYVVMRDITTLYTFTCLRV